MKRYLLPATVALAGLALAMPTMATAKPETTATVTNVSFPPGSSAINVTVSIDRRIDREARKQNREHSLTVQVTYDSANATTETVSTTVLVSDTTLIGELPDKRRAVLVEVPLGSAPPPGGTPNFQATAQLTIAPGPGQEGGDD